MYGAKNAKIPGKVVKRLGGGCLGIVGPGWSWDRGSWSREVIESKV